MSKSIKILLAEDELSLGKIIAESLTYRGFEVMHCFDGKDALEKYNTNQFDILILDVMMPNLDGFTLAKKIRETNTSIPVLFLTAKSQTIDVIEGFNVGGNDYLKKPFAMEELVVRIQSLVNAKKTTTLENNEVDIGLYSFNSKKQRLYYNNAIINLTSRESDLLYQLFLHKNNVLDKDYILNKLWGDNDFFKARSLDVFISKLRKKLSKDNQIQIINTRGFGYKLVC